MTETGTFRSASELSSAVIVNDNKTYRAVGQYEGAVIHLALDDHSLRIQAHEQKQAFIDKGKMKTHASSLQDTPHADKAAERALDKHNKGTETQKRMNAATSLRDGMKAGAKVHADSAQTPTTSTMTVSSTQVTKPKQEQGKPTLLHRMEELGALLGYFPLFSSG